MPFLLKILCIHIIIQTCYALVGCQLFYGIDKGYKIDNLYQNFSNFANAFLILFKCSSGDDWRAIMADCMYHNPYCKEDSSQCGSYLAIPYFMSYELVSAYIILNLFVLALVDQFESNLIILINFYFIRFLQHLIECNLDLY